MILMTTLMLNWKVMTLIPFAGYYLTGVGTIPTTEKLSYELVSQNKQLILTNDKVKNGRVTKVKVQITEVEIEEETE